ncbi:hypothetical protein GOBAR_AA02714 [Gossypium barbadense]|uniref:Uncharacterized protein n=1 Tax=Gossypium barbadense TaxID=3634 RepID=A0A2P5YQR3_GOSBA|nr:hypothetical protein GOBAR_AA02714 [Gossypium barbadense]
MGNSRSSTSRHGVGEGQGYVYAPLWCWLIMRGALGTKHDCFAGRSTMLFRDGLFVLPLRGETWHLIRLVAMGNSRSSTSRHGVGEGQGYVYAPWWCWLIMWVEARAKPGVMSK